MHDILFSSLSSISLSSLSLLHVLLLFTLFSLLFLSLSLSLSQDEKGFFESDPKLSTIQRLAAGPSTLTAEIKTDAFDAFDATLKVIRHGPFETDRMKLDGKIKKLENVTKNLTKKRDELLEKAASMNEEKFLKLTKEELDRRWRSMRRYGDEGGIGNDDRRDQPLSQ